MDIIANTNDELFISVHGIIGPRTILLTDNILYPPDNNAARRIRIGNIEITLFEKEG